MKYLGYTKGKKYSNLQVSKFEDALKKKKKNAYRKSSTAKMSSDAIDEEIEKSPLNSVNLLVSQEKQPFVSLLKQILILDANLHKKNYMWREHKELLEALKRSIRLFPIPEASILMHETLFSYAQKAVKPLQYISLEILASLIVYSYDLEESESITKEIITEWAEAKSSRLQCLFVDFFEICWSLPFTFTHIVEKLFIQLVAVSKSPYRSVKLRILKMIPNIRPLLNDADILEEITSMLLRFNDEEYDTLTMKTENTKILMYKWKCQDKEIKGKEEEKILETERQKKADESEELLQELSEINKVLVEERVKRDEELK